MLIAVLVLTTSVRAPEARAHEMTPSLLEVRVTAAGAAEVKWKVGLKQPKGQSLEPVFPDSCERTGSPTADVKDGALITRYRVRCGFESWVGQTIGVDGLRPRTGNALLRFVRSDGTVVQSLFSASSPSLVIPERAAATKVMSEYLVLGIEHLVFGFDHVLFILGLLLLVHGRRRLVLTITAFTVGHSVTLALAALGLVRVPTGPIEAAIAASILVLAAEIGRDPTQGESWLQRWPWAMALGFGLLHGLGFAGALSAVGLPSEEIPAALFSFNVGIEIGQLAVAVAAWVLWAGLRALYDKPLPRLVQLAPGYAIGCMAGYWFLERTLGIFGFLV